MTHIPRFMTTKALVVGLAPQKLMSLIIIVGVCGCAPTNNLTLGDTACPITLTSHQTPPTDLPRPEDYFTVDCLLPGQVINTGMYTQWVSRPRPAIMSAWECAIQGGDYAVGSNTDARQKAINVWQECANNGNQAAQNYLGEIYAKTWGNTPPDYTRAAQWFRKAAEQGFSRAQNNLGALYEQGLGVPKDKAQAYKLMRQAIGLIEPVDLDSGTAQKIQAIEHKQDSTEQQLKQLQQQLSSSEQRLQQKQNELDALKNNHQKALAQTSLRELANAQQKNSQLQAQLAATRQLLDGLRKQSDQAKTLAALGEMPNLGKYHALIIGINNYQPPLHQLKTAVSDARKVDELLRTKYGFNTLLITDDTVIKPTRDAIVKALENFTRSLNADDNLLVYYAGHGDISNTYSWLPQDAEQDSSSHWISVNDIVKQISLPPLNAKHVLFVVDSCFPAGLINAYQQPQLIKLAATGQTLVHSRAVSDAVVQSATPLALHTISSDELVGVSPEAQVAWIKAKAKLPSRRALTSGRLEKVLDEDNGNGLSIFASAFVEALKNNTRAISAEQIALDISPIVFGNAQKHGGNQVPVYAPIEKTGDNHGEFFFVPRH